jgi:hypothetical protein
VPSMSIDKTPHFASQRRILARPRKEGVQAISFHDNTGRAAFDDEVRKRIDVGRASANRQLQPRLCHDFLCHSGASGSIDDHSTRGATRLVKIVASRY